MKSSPLKDYNKLADTTLSLSNRDDEAVAGMGRFKSLIENQVFSDGTHAYLSSNDEIFNKHSHLEKKYGYPWYRSTDTVMSEYPHHQWLSKKKWPLNEQLNLHMLNYQEV